MPSTSSLVKNLRRDEILLSALVACAAACGSRGSAEEVEERLRAQLDRQTGREVVQVSCPEGEGKTLAPGLVCSVTFEGGESAQVEVVGTGLAGGVELRVVGVSPTDQLEKIITERLTDRYGVAFESTKCAEVAVKKGATFECAAIMEGGVSLPVNARWIDNRGGYEYADKGVVEMDRVERALRAQLEARGARGRVECPGKILPSEPESSFDCSIRYAGGESGAAEVTITDWGGHVRWEFR